MCICLFDDGPTPDDKYGARQNMFKVGMKDAPLVTPRRPDRPKRLASSTHAD